MAGNLSDVFAVETPKDRFALPFVQPDKFTKTWVLEFVAAVAEFGQRHTCRRMTATIVYDGWRILME